MSLSIPTTNGFAANSFNGDSRSPQSQRDLLRGLGQFEQTDSPTTADTSSGASFHFAIAFRTLILPSAVAMPELVREQLPPRGPARPMRIRHVHVAAALAPVRNCASKIAWARCLELRRADHMQYPMR